MNIDRGAVFIKDKQLGGRRHSGRREEHIFDSLTISLKKQFKSVLEKYINAKNY